MIYVKNLIIASLILTIMKICNWQANAFECIGFVITLFFFLDEADDLIRKIIKKRKSLQKWLLNVAIFSVYRN